MSYRLKSRETVADGLKRIFREEIDSALKQTRRRPQHRGQAVHEFRKHLKKLRAALSLAAEAVGKNRYDLEDRIVRQVAKVVSSVRDAHVRLQTVIQIRKRFCNDDFGKVFQRIEGLLALEAESFAAAAAGWEKQVVPKLRGVEKRVSQWPLEDLTPKQICSAVAKSYRRGRDRLADALEKPEPENFHSWRKEVKQLWYQLRILAPLNRVVLEEIARDAKTLGELLGQQHDFVFLLSRLDQERDDELIRSERTKLEKLIRRRNRKLQRASTELGRRFYAESPKAFAKRISIFIKDWAGSKKK
jgi:CHAD domain-containing protein